MPPGQGQCKTQRISAYFGRYARHFTCNRRANKSLGNNEKSHRSLPAQGARLRVLVSDAIRLLTADSSTIARILRRHAADRGPIEAVAARREQPQKSVVEQAAERHGHAQ